MGFLVWIIGGIVAGWLTGQIMGGGGFGLVGDLIVGLIGGFIGGYVGSFFGIQPTNFIGGIALAVVGGIIFVALLRLIRRA